MRDLGLDQHQRALEDPDELDQPKLIQLAQPKGWPIPNWTCELDQHVLDQHGMDELDRHRPDQLLQRHALDELD